MGSTSHQHLIPHDTRADIDRSLEAQLADPLWGLSRQLLLGEFEAESGGRPAQIETVWSSTPVAVAELGDELFELEPGRPMESLVEAEDDLGTPPAWDPSALEYRFSVHAGSSELRANGYDGRDLDWYHFERVQHPATDPDRGDELVQRSIPSRLTWRGLPHPSWWRFEEGGVHFVPERDPLPNALSVLLPEFAFLDANDWYVVPVEGVAGALQRVHSVRMVDSFGFVTQLDPGIGRRPGETWRAFTLSEADPTRPADGALLFCPDTAASLQQGDVVEELLFVRDEAANQAWAVELAYQDPATGKRVDRRDEEARRLPPPTQAAAGQPGDLPRFRLRSELAAHWIPYVPRRVAPDDPSNAQIYFRRGRTLAGASRAQPQFRTKLVDESWRVLEESLPRTGLRLQRIWHFARHNDGTPLFWTARRKSFQPNEHSAGIELDYLT